MQGGTVTQPAHLLLRESTRHAHETTEATDGMHRLMAGSLDEAGYAGLLRAQWQLYREWETARAGWLDALADGGWPYISRAGLLEADLGGEEHRLQGRFSQEQAGMDGASAGVDAARAWGELYVIEGSSLGGRVIVRRLRELYPARSHRFYAVGEESPSSWRRFQALLDTHLTHDASRHAAVEGALHMFARFREALKDPAGHV